MWRRSDIRPCDCTPNLNPIWLEILGAVSLRCPAEVPGRNVAGDVRTAFALTLCRNPRVQSCWRRRAKRFCDFLPKSLTATGAGWSRGSFEMAPRCRYRGRLGHWQVLPRAAGPPLSSAATFALKLCHGRPWISLAAEPAARGKGLPRRPLRTANFVARPCREFGCPWQRPATASGPRGKALPATPTKKPCVWPGERLPRARGKVLPRAQALSRARPPVGWPGCPRRGRGGPGEGLSRECHGSGRPWQGLATDPAARGKARVEALPGARPPAAQPCHGPGRPPRNAAAGRAARGKALPLAWQSVATGSGAHGHGPAVRGNSLRRARSSVAKPRRGPGRHGKALPRAR